MYMGRGIYLNQFRTRPRAQQRSIPAEETNSFTFLTSRPALGPAERCES
jgi:hypothetical protein